MIGLSLSFCIKEMVEGKVDPATVSKLIVGTQCATPEQWEDVLTQYCRVYWIKNPDACDKLARQFIAEGKVEQPRLRGDRFSISNGIWVETELDIQWVPEDKAGLQRNPYC